MDKEKMMHALAMVIKQSAELAQKEQEAITAINNIQKALLVTRGKQEALSELFLDGKDITLQQALDDNVDGLKDSIINLP